MSVIADNITFTSSSWSTVKKNARDVIYVGNQKTFYCGCTYTSTGFSGGAIDQASCGYDGSGVSHNARAVRLEWEHYI
jgi:deoxyribonuclease-1